ncbi:hypothetical protein ABMA27_007707 [Loxostege sticticalis]|uniref:Uncharacterized protein n=1 Tax=Loxostege sticticalis TaxID=481309 RepID=A0ABR3HCM7_LOXSC
MLFQTIIYLLRVRLAHEGFRTIIFKNGKKHVCCMGAPLKYFFSLSSSSVSESISSGASSVETKERKRATQAHRVCTPCPHDMLKAHKNLGIKWICAGYQRARRTFKSECMMRYRNCQDGTLFVKLSDHRCKNDTYHGKHWFYVYRV